MSQFSRRSVLGALAGPLAAAKLAVPARAQSDYPNRPVRVIVGFAAGGGNDIFARLVGDADEATPPELAREIAGAIGGARLQIIPDCGHLSTLEQPETVTAALIEWMS